MMDILFSAQGAIGAYALSLIVFGFAPGMVLAAIVRLIPDLDRRRELQAELYEVPRWERPYWVAQQFEVAIRVGLAEHVAWYWGRFVWHRATVESGLARHLAHPDTFEIPDDREKAALVPGDLVKLAFAVRRMPGERMWVRITHRRGNQLVGRLNSYPVFAHLDVDSRVKFQVDDIIDFYSAEEFAARGAASSAIIE